MNIIEEVTNAQLKKDIPIFSSGDTIKVISKALDDKKGRKQSFEGVVIKRHGSGISKTFTLRKISYGVGVEKTFPLHSPTIEEIKVTHEEKSKRAKLYYLRKKKGKR